MEFYQLRKIEEIRNAARNGNNVEQTAWSLLQVYGNPVTAWAEARKMHFPPLTPTRVTSTIKPAFPDRVSLHSEHSRQSSKLAELYASELGLSVKDYVSYIPWFAQRPSEPTYVQNEWLPLIVQGDNIHFVKQARLSKMAVSPSTNIDLDHIPASNISKRLLGIYTTWVRVSDFENQEFSNLDADIYENIAFGNAFPETAKYKRFKLSDQRGLSIFYGVRPEIVSNLGRDDSNVSYLIASRHS